MAEPRAVFVHEDDAGQIELMPFSAWEACEVELRGELSSVASDVSDDLSVLGVPARAVHEIISREFVSIDDVVTGYGSHREPYSGATAYCHEGHPVMFVLSGADNVVVTIWLAYHHDDDSRPALARVLFAVGRTYQLMIIDRVLGRLADLRDAKSIDEYLNIRSDQERRVAKSVKQYKAVWRRISGLV